MSIHIIEGLPRHGKTTFAVQHALEWRAYWKKKGGNPRRIIANFPVNVPGVEYVERFWEMKNVDHAIFLIDEAYKWFGTEALKNDPSMISFFTEHGKDANTIYLIAHKAAMLDVNVRERTAETVWHVRRIWGPTRWEEPSRTEKIIGWWSICRQFMSCDQKALKTSKPMKTRFICLNKLHGKFDTLTKIGLLHEGKNKTGAGLAASSGLPGGAASRRSVSLLSGEVLRKVDYLLHSDLCGWGGRVRWHGKPEDVGEAIFGKRSSVTSSAPTPMVPVLMWADDGLSYKRVFIEAGTEHEFASRERAKAKGKQSVNGKTDGSARVGVRNGIGNDRGDGGRQQNDASRVELGGGNQQRFRLVGTK